MSRIWVKHVLKSRMLMSVFILPADTCFHKKNDRRIWCSVRVWNYFTNESVTHSLCGKQSAKRAYIGNKLFRIYFSRLLKYFGSIKLLVRFRKLNKNWICLKMIDKPKKMDFRSLMISRKLFASENYTQTPLFCHPALHNLP